MAHSTCRSCAAALSATETGRCSRCKWAERPKAACVSCGAPTGWAATDKRAESAMCRECFLGHQALGSEGKPTECAFCGDPFRSQRRSAKRGGGWIRCCSKSCARKLEIREGRHPIMAGRLRDENPDWKRDKGAKTRRARRAKLAKVEREVYSLDEIAERDGFRCGLCHRKVNMELRWPHKRSASVDHLVPISWGGNDVRSNVQLAHLGCNLDKGARVEWAQEMLVG